ncbi:MAG: matrixin family metalloprotease [Pyrinomonadaceae bacterium]
MSRTLTSLLLSAFMLWAAMPVHSYTYQFTSSSVQLKWATNTINIALSNSLNNPPANIKPGSDVVGAARRALRRWSDAANIQFVETFTNLETVNPPGTPGDGVNLITVSPAAVNTNFTGGRLGRMRVIFDASTGRIQESDLAISPAVQFSTDGTSGTYDLESTFVHELGHLLGLDHSGVIGATMQPRQGQNFTEPAFTMRTLSDDDLAGIRSIYGARGQISVGSIAGQVNYGAGAYVWAENLFTGRVAGSSITRSDGSYRIDQVPPGDYRVMVEYLDDPVVAREISNAPPYSGIGSQSAFRTTESQTNVAAGTTSILNLIITLGEPSLNPRILGLNGVLQAAPVQLAAGRVYRFAVGGSFLNNVPLTAAGLSVASPFINIDPASFTRENPANYGITEPNYGIISFNLVIADSAKFGDYSLRLRSDAGEVVYLSGALDIDPNTNFVELNPLENNIFFVRQQYLDFLFREPDASGAESWLRVLGRCDANLSPDCDRITVSSAFFRSQEFQIKGFFIYRFYSLALKRQPTYAEIIPDMQFVTGQTEGEVYAKRAAYSNSFVTRAMFRAGYDNLTNAAYVDTLLGRYDLTRINTIDPANPDTGAQVTLTRDDLVNRLNSTTFTRAQILRAIAESQEVASREFNPGFVAIQYFGYLKRDAEPAGFNAWLNYLTTHPGDFRTMVNGFTNSQEYRSRFGQP